MSNSNIIKILEERELITQLTHKESLLNKLLQKPISLYCGFDPTADSLHLGHIVPLFCLKHFQNAGHRPIILIGGATGLIGDPSFKSKERKLNESKIVKYWSNKIERQIANFLNINSEFNSVMILNNLDWFDNINLLDFLRDIGKYFSVNKMINKESIIQRLNRDDYGISFTEFSYNLLQSYDFAYLNKKYNVSLQIGGSDQWGNITSGIDLTRRLNNKQVFGLTVPLITKSDGTKFGKTENETIWLDANKTTPYKFYQFWINTSDTDVYRFLKIFTFMNVEEINNLKNNNIIDHLAAQKILAQKVTYLIHGEKGLITAEHITNCLFTNDLNNMTESDFEELAYDGMPTIKLKKSDNYLQQALLKANFAPSLSQARTLISQNAIYINGKKELNQKYQFQKSDKYFNKYTLIRRGKKKHCLIDWL
ncbi:MAG: tyrosine--tRNA ligase [Pantoea sp. Brub]|nr:tyrosine--tRNA ligase [Pantoea sp. Brub]